MEAVRYMVHCRLNDLAAGEGAALSSHFDEDTISAFVEGRVDDNESAAIISHLTQCNSCREFTAHLIRIESIIGAESEETVTDEHPSRLQQFLSGLASHLIPSGEDAVFAYHHPDEEKEQSDEKTSDDHKPSSDS